MNYYGRSDETYADDPEPVTFIVSCERFDAEVGAGLGDVEWLPQTGKRHECRITTDRPQALMAQLDGDKNVWSYEAIYDNDDDAPVADAEPDYLEPPF